MALDHVRHVEACALLKRILDDAGEHIPYRAVVEGWLEENHPSPEAYIDSMRSLADRGPLPAVLHNELVPRGFK